MIDKKLTSKIISLPGICTFGNAISWNSFASRVYSDLGIELVYIKELAQCLMMSTVLCENPTQCTDICPNLPYGAIYELLKNQRSDEYMPIINDTTKFKNHFENEIQTSNDIIIEIDLKDIVQNLKTDDWDKLTSTEQELNEFPFLKSHFIAP